MIAMGAIMVAWLAAAQSGGAVDPYDFERARARVVRGAVAAVEPSLVTIDTIGGAQPVREQGPHGVVEESFRIAEGPTTGLVLSADGYIVTSSFNFAREPSIITVAIADGRQLVARLVARDHIRRLALVKVDATDLTPPQWVPAEELRVGQYAIACGRGLGGSQTFVSLGILSALDRRNGNAVQTDAKISPVNYGGPLIDVEGRVIGILVPMAGSGGALAGAEWYDGGIGFAIYKHRFDEVHERLVAGEDIEQGKIGVILEPDEESLIPMLDKILPPTPGVRIREVARHSPAERAKLNDGDKITAIDGKPTGDLMEIQRRLSDRAAGEDITLTIRRRWRTFDVTLTLARAADIGRKPQDEGAPESQPAPGADLPPATQPSEDAAPRPVAD